MTDKIATKFYIYRPSTPEPEVSNADLPKEPGYARLREIMEPLLDGAMLEHVSVLFEDRRADMFVDEMGMIKELPRNDAATDIYRANWLKHHPDSNPDDSPAIYGAAIVFDRLVWF